MIGRVLLGAAAAALVLVLTPTAVAAAPTTLTTTVKDRVHTELGSLPPCPDDGPLYTITSTSNLIQHDTVFDDGRVHGVLSETGTFTAVPFENVTLPAFTGSFTFGGHFNQNSDSVVNGTVTLSVRGKGSDGSRLSVQAVEHFNTRPDGSVNHFFHCH